ncbi:pyridoxal phosphate-dependent aminotransferase [Candidatus Falkowbacteria bacterium]|nr:pyridoxal phosphate-dependent aminotransferase [Candidatus Falkowbacteria bacterium]
MGHVTAKLGMTADSRGLRSLETLYRRFIKKRKKEIKAYLRSLKHETIRECAPELPIEIPGIHQARPSAALEDEIFGSSVSPHFIGTAAYYKGFFNHFFHHDLYGQYDSEENVIISTGALDQDEMKMPDSLKYAIDFALANNWYGYSCSLGRESAREAIADLEKIKTGDDSLSPGNVVLIKGVTDGLYHLVSFLKEQSGEGEFNILTHLPTYIPFATACEKIAPTEFVNLGDNFVSPVEKIMQGIKKETKAILLLADMNPLGKALTTADLNRLADHCSSRKIFLIVDEAGAKYPEIDRRDLKPNPYLIRLESLSKKISVPGMKLGYFVADAALVSKFYERASTCYGGPASFFYLLQEFEARFHAFSLQGIENLGHDELKLFDHNYRLSMSWLQTLYDDYRLNRYYYSKKIESQRAYAIQTLRSHMPALVSEIIVPETGINVFVRLNLPSDSYGFFRKLLLKKRVAVFPGICSGVDGGAWVRITVGVSKETLIKGLEGLISCLKEEFAANAISNDHLYYAALMDWGGYGVVDNIDFSSHLYDVCRNTMVLRKHLNVRIEEQLNDSDLFDLVMCHDAGKVVSVLVWRMRRVLRLQKRYARTPQRILGRWRDEDLLGWKDKLARGCPVGLDEFYECFPFVSKFKSVIDWDSAKPQKDTVFTRYILENLQEKTAGESERIGRILAAISKEVWDIPQDGQLSAAEISAIILDAADKVADFELENTPSRAQVIAYLRQKEKYAKRRYGKADGLPTSAISKEFKIIKRLIDKVFDFE